MTSILVRALIKAKQTHNLILELHPASGYVPDVRNTMFHSLSDLVIKHFGSIILLVESRQHTGSALALLRPLIETFLRASWTLHTATDDQLTQIAKGRKSFPGFHSCKNSVEAFYARGGYKNIFMMSEGFIDNLHGFTHSGVEQVMNRIGPDLEITPHAYSDEIKMRLLDTSARFAVQSAMLLIQHVDGTHDTLATKVEELERRFTELSNH